MVTNNGVGGGEGGGGSILWDTLDKNVQEMLDVRKFTNEAMKGYKIYADLLN